MTEQEYATAMLSLAHTEKRLDPNGTPIPMYGVRHTDNVMRGVQYLADIGGCEWKDYKEGKTYDNPDQLSFDIEVEYTPITAVARKVADDLGYTSVGNCTAMWREAIDSGLVDEDAVSGRLSVSDYGFTELEKYEDDVDGW